VETSVLPGNLIGRLGRLVFWGLIDIAIPLGVVVGLVTFLADPSHTDVAELRANSLLMGARPIFREVAAPDELRVALGNSAILLGTAMCGAIALGVPAGIAYGWSRSRAIKSIAWAAATLASSLPAFFWAVALELIMIALWLQFGLRLLPTAGFGVDQHLLLPALALGIRPAGYVFRLTSLAIEETSRAEYVRTARAKGLTSASILRRHALPNAMPQIVSAVVLAVRGALSSLLIVEFVYIWGGAGTTFIQALGQRRFGLAWELALAFGLASVLLALLADVARARPRPAS
jgi:ABC-type dipeptide/oligopeptide/nickel transport system permease component